MQRARVENKYGNAGLALSRHLYHVSPNFCPHISCQLTNFECYDSVAASFTSTGEFLATITSFRAIALYRKTADGFKLEAFDDFSDLRAKGYLAEGISWIDDRSLIVTDIRGRFIKLVRSPADHDEILHPRRKRVIIDTPIHYQAKGMWLIF